MIGVGFFLLSKVYDKVRPNYDFDSISKILTDEFDLNTKLNAAEIGAGSGKFTTILLQTLNFNKLIIVEPEEAAIREHQEKFNFFNAQIKYINAYSDSTTIQEHSLDCIFVSQAFHFFQIEQTRKEFLRILKPNGKVFIFGRFLLEKDEVSRQFIYLTRFGKRLNGYTNNLQAYEEEKISLFFGKNIKKKIIKNEIFAYTKEELLDNLKLRINSSGDNDLINNKEKQEELIDSIIVFYNKYKDKNNKVLLEYQNLYYCSEFVIK